MTRSGDQPTSFRPPIAAIRWGTIAIGLVLAVTEPAASMSRTALGGVVLVGYALWRTLRPIPLGPDSRPFAAVLVEVALHVLVVVDTGYWSSPFVFSLLTAIIVAGFAGSFAFALEISVVSIVAVGLPFLALADDLAAAGRTSAQWAVELVLVAVVTGYARRLTGEAEERHSLALDRLGRLAEANSLLYSLNQVAQTLPASLDLDEVLDSTVTRLRSFFDLTAVAILLPDETSTSWEVVRQEGVRLPRALDDAELPPAIRQTSRSRRSVLHQHLDVAAHQGVASRSRSGLYAPLLARGQLVGVVAVEHDEEGRFSPLDVNLLDGFTEAAALAVDNARWFRRLRTVGADEERTRIARELHDRVGQSLAYLAFELDRMMRFDDDVQLRDGLGSLRQDLRTVIGEVRDTLYDLRTDVSETQGFVDTVEQFLDRVRQRTEIDISFTAERESRLPLPQEREMWRILQEAVTNAERHSRCSILRIWWRCDEVKAELEVADNGIGFEMGKAGRMDSYGMLGMRERAAAIGAVLQIDSAPGRGTRVRCRVEL